MKSRIAILFFGSIFSSCSKTMEETSEKLNDSIEIHTQRDSKNMFKKDSIIHEYGNLPFGCNLLVTHKFPKKWETQNLDLINPKAKYKPHVKEFYDLIPCFNTLNNTKAISLPQINKLEYYEIGNYDNELFKDSLINSIDSFRYRLPDFGIYDCYYTYNNNHMNTKEAGYLLLYNRALKSAKVLNIYNSMIEEISTNYRFFFINDDKTINIFEAYSGETEMSLINKYTVNVLSNGEIKIKENK